MALLVANLLIILWGSVFYQSSQVSNASIESSSLTQKLYLLSEVDNVKTQKNNRKTDEVTDEWLIVSKEKKSIVNANNQAGLCHQVGIFNSKRKAKKVMSVFKSLGLKPKLNKQVSRKKSGFWVIYPAPATMKKSIDMIDYLRSQGYQESWLFTEGENKGAISLGLYKNIRGAESRKQELLTHNIVTIIKSRLKEDKKYWLTYRSKKKYVMPPEIAKFIKKEDPIIKFSTKDCQ